MGMQVNRLRRLRWSLICVGVICWRFSAWAGESPQDIITTTTKQAVTALQDPTYQGNNHRHERIEKMWEVILPRFDTMEIAKRCLGAQWGNLTEAQQAEFVQLFLQLVRRSYGDTLDRYAKDARFSFEKERLDNGFAEVDTRVETPAQATPLSLTYKLHRVGDTWKIYDVVAENVSLVRNYRNQFNRVLQESSYEGLKQALQQKLEELDASSSVKQKG